MRRRWQMAKPGLIHVFLNVSFLLLAFFLLSRGGAACTSSSKNRRRGLLGMHSEGGCDGVRRMEGFKERCDYVMAMAASEHRCYPGGYVNYLYLFYCVCGEKHRGVGYALLLTWLTVLFYLLGDTAAVYFCSSLEGLSRLLRLTPAMAGATLLSLGNGAPDALSTVASFAGGGSTAVGLNGVLGGALFVSSAVLGVIGVFIGGRGVAVDKGSFLRDAIFLLCALAAVTAVVLAGRITVWGSLAFPSLYLAYVLAVSLAHGCTSKAHDAEAACASSDDSTPSDYELRSVIDAKFCSAQEPLLDQSPLLQNYTGRADAKRTSVLREVARVLKLPLSLPRRLTIPDASKERWRKPVAVTAVTLSPLFLASLWYSKTSDPGLVPLAFGGLAGLLLGALAFATTEKERPPTRFLAPWLAAGFLMSVTWAYVVAQELLALLVSIGVVLAVDSAMLGLTVLAWGNSLGDLIANVAVAARGGEGGAQAAVSGCYGGPLFNMLVGLGLSLALSCWAAHPEPVAIPRDPGVYQAVGFVAAAVLWPLVMLPRRGMTVDRDLGFGLLCIYLCFLGLSIVQSLGLTDL